MTRSTHPQRQRAPRRRTGGSDLLPRVLVAIPAIVFAAVIIGEGGLVFALGLILLGTFALGELYTLMARVKPTRFAGFLAMAGLVLAALYGDQYQMVLALAASVAAIFLLTLMLRRERDNVSWAMAATLFGVVWIGLPLAHGVLLRELPHGGALVLDVCVGTFVGDTAAYFGGRWYGRTPLAPRISPNKTLEGLVFGIVGGTLAFWLFAISYQDWFAGDKALLIGFSVALAAPFGDLFESLVKRDLEVKDTGKLFGAHGGALDRLDAIFFTIVTAYYVVQVLEPL